MICSDGPYSQMISRQQYLQALSHPDFYVRSGVLRMFSEEGDPGLDVTRAACAAIDQFGARKAFEHPYQLSKLAIAQSRTIPNAFRSRKFSIASWSCKGLKTLISINGERGWKRLVTFSPEMTMRIT